VMIPSKISLIVVDALRYDCVGYQSDKKYLEKSNVLQHLHTPTIDKLSKESICFTKCYSTSSFTSPVIATMFTGTKQVNHGVVNNTSNNNYVILNEKTLTIAEILKKLGYITIYAGDPPLGLKRHQLQRGFDHDFSKNDKKLFEFLDKNKNNKIFLFTIFEDVHGPYLFSNVPPTEGYNDDYFATMKPLLQKYNVPLPKNSNYYWHDLFKVDGSRKLWFPLYVKGVSKFDTGRFKYFVDNLEATGFLEPDESLLIITADHGEGKHTHKLDKFQHGADAYDETTRVPLIVRLPSLKHEIKPDLVSTVDIFKIIIDQCSDNKTNELINHKLYCINPFFEKRKFCWYILSLAPYDKDYPKYCVHARTIITDDKKFVLRGKPETFFDKSVFELNELDFVYKLYFDLLGRRAEADEFKKNVDQLETGEISKKELYEQFLNSRKYTKRKKYFVLDSKNDPFEEKLINPFSNVDDTEEYLRYFKEIIEIERPDMKVEFSTNNIDESEEEEIKKELKAMGYLD